jgi:hypothetical protein
MLGLHAPQTAVLKTVDEATTPKETSTDRIGRAPGAVENDEFAVEHVALREKIENALEAPQLVAVARYQPTAPLNALIEDQKKDRQEGARPRPWRRHWCAFFLRGLPEV